MSLASQQSAAGLGESEPDFSVELSNVGVRFEVPTERILSFKEYVVRRVKRQISYRELWALSEVDLKIRAGEVFGLVGRNGAGKSTLLKVVARVLQPTTGRVIVRGTLAPMLELGAGFHPDLTGTENVLLNATLLGIPRKAIQRSLPDVMGFAELQAFANAPVRTYSSGMLSRLGFAVATLFRPEILILDEVLAVGDVGFKEKCLDRIREFVRAGTTVLLVSHSLDVFEHHCHRVAWLEQGKVMALGTPAEVVPLYHDAVIGS